MKILHLADTHVRDKDIDECRKVLTFIVDQAREQQPDLIIHAGDVFDSQNIKLDSPSAKLVFRILSDLADIAPVIIVIGTPSHDGLAIEVASHIKAVHPIHVSTRPEQLYLSSPDILTEPPPNDFVSIAEAVISCVPSPTKQFFQGPGSIAESDQQIGEAMTAMFAGFAASAASYDAPHALVGHFQVGAAFVSPTQQLIGRDIEVSRAQIEAANADLVCLGHIHLAQKIGGSIFYSGSTYQLTYGETENKGFYVHTLSDDEFKGQFIGTPTRKLVKHDFDLTGSADLPGLIMDGAVYKGEVEGADVKLEISVYEDEIDQLSKAVFEEAFPDANSVDIQIIRIPRENVRSERLLHLTSLRDKLIERAALVKEELDDSVLEKADRLEGEDQEQIFNQLSAA